MSINDPQSAVRTGGTGLTHRHDDQRLTTETKAAFKTTESLAYFATVVAVLIAASLVDEKSTGGSGASQAWLYVTLLSFGYMLSRGIAKSGSRDPYWQDRDGDHR